MPHPSSRAALTAAAVATSRVLWHALRLLLAALLALVVAAPIAAATASAAPGAAEADPLVVHLDEITTLARPGGKVRISGTVTNTSTDTWTRVNLHAFSSASPILDAPLLAAAAETDPADFVGERVTTPGTFDTIDLLEPGQSDTFSLSVPVALLGIDAESGVYWIGVHALGDGGVPRDGFADGKARTFIPSLPRSDASVPVALAVPLRGRIWYESDGRLAGAERWTKALSENGRYAAALDVAQGAGSTRSSWVVDPAVLTAISRLAAGNPPRSLGPDPTVPGQEPTTPPEEGSEPPGEEVSPPLASVAPTSPAEQTEAELALAALAREWMASFIETAAGQDVLALPFGDLDVSAAARYAPERIEEATTRSREIMEGLGITYRPVIAPQEGLLSPEALSAVPPETTVLVSDTAFSVPPQSPTSLVRLLGHRVVVTSSGAASGGPGPTASSDPLALRQRMLSEAALRLTDGSAQPLVVSLPRSWNPTDAQVLLKALDQPWVEPATITDLASAQAVGVPSSSLVYTDADLESELDDANFAAVDRLVATSTVMEEVLTLETTIERQVLDEALSTVSSQHRSRPQVAARSAGRLEGHLRDQLGSIRVETPKAVTLSSDSGPLGTTLVNGLDQPVTVALDLETDGDIELDGTGVRQLPPESRTLARLEASAARPGIHTVRLFVTSESGEPLGSARELPIRAAQVSGFIWFAMAVGAGLLFGAIALRLWRQVRRRRTGQPGDAQTLERSAA